MDGVRLGALVLDAPIGVGGTGEVWRGVHSVQGVPVAVKVITAARARDDRYREAFANEVRAVAGLSHPGVVLVFDTGTVDAAAERATDGRMVAGSPYLAMELADGRLDLHQPRSWSLLRAELLWLLDVLSHAHAHGVIHRDLKPGNVLRFADPAVPGDAEGATRLRLTDFGLAHLTDSAERPIRGTSGTPLYMAPEQFRGSWRDFGPSTDLYALGCVAFALATGRSPYQGRHTSGLMYAHLTQALPEVNAAFPVPDGFQAWVWQLMQKEPAHRFQRAADAAFALRELGEDAATAPRAASFIHRRIPPVPTSWKVPLPPPRIELVGAGLGLYGVRAIPLVGREAERDAIWQALAECRRTGRPRACVLRGEAGAGKSRLAEWIARRAEEVGSAVVVRATHSAAGGAADGLPRMVSSAVGAIGLPRDLLVERLQKWLRRRGERDDYEWKALAELLWPERGGSSFGSANERYALIARLLGQLGAHHSDDGERRPVVLWLDDVQWGGDALGLADHLLRRTEPDLPALILMTVRHEALAERPAEKAQLDRIEALPTVTRLDIGPLAASERKELVERLLLLEGELAAEVEERTGGNPMFAVQLVGDWVQRGVLEIGTRGFVLRAGERAFLPDDIHALWNARIGQVLEGRPDSARVVLEIAALLGTEVDAAEWQAACRIARQPIPDDLVAAMLAQRLVEGRTDGWSFAHGMLRESLERAAIEQGRAPELHDACATTLQIRFGVARLPGLAERLGRHLLSAGRAAEAIEPLRLAAEERRAISDYHGAMRILDLRDEALRAVGAASGDPRWGQEMIDRAGVLVGLGRLEEAARVAAEVVRSEAKGWELLRPAALRWGAVATAKQRGRLGEAEALLLEGERAAITVGDEAELARCLLLLGDVTRLVGRTEEAMTFCRRALEKFESMLDRRGHADALVGLAAVTRSRGDHAETERLVRQAIVLFEEIGARFGVATAHNSIGDALRAQGRLEEAEHAYEQAQTLLGSLDSPDRYVPLLNLGLVLLARGRFREAGDRLEVALAQLQRAGRRGMEGMVHVALLPVTADRQDWPAFRKHHADARALLAASGIVDPDIALAAEQAVDLASRAGARAEALDALAIAHTQWQALGDVARQTSLEGRRATL